MIKEALRNLKKMRGSLSASTINNLIKEHQKLAFRNHLTAAIIRSKSKLIVQLAENAKTQNKHKIKAKELTKAKLDSNLTLGSINGFITNQKETIHALKTVRKIITQKLVTELDTGEKVNALADEFDAKGKTFLTHGIQIQKAAIGQFKLKKEKKWSEFTDVFKTLKQISN